MKKFSSTLSSTEIHPDDLFNMKMNLGMLKKGSNDNLCPDGTESEKSRWKKEIDDFMQVVFAYDLNVIGAARYLRSHPISHEAIAVLGFRCSEIISKNKKANKKLKINKK